MHLSAYQDNTIKNNLFNYTLIYCRYIFDRFLYFLPIGIFLFLNAKPLCALPLREGLDYQRQTTANSQVVHVLSIDPQKFSMVSLHAKGQAQGLSTLLDLAKEHQAIAAINGGYFHNSDKKDGLPAGILKIQGKWYGIAYSNRAAVGWSMKHDQNNAPTLLIDRIQTRTTLKIKNLAFPVHTLNQPGGADRAVIYTPTFGEFAASNPNSTYFIVKNNRIIDIKDSNANSDEITIPENGFVYSLGNKVNKPHSLPTQGDKANFNIEVIPNKGGKQQRKIWQDFDNIVGGTPLLVYNGQLQVNPNHKHMQSPFATYPRARTALGIDARGHWIWVVVENNHQENIRGMTLMQLAEFMKALGCVAALNMDGGSSTALYLEDKLVTSPEDDESEGLLFPMFRRIGDAILLKEK